MAMDRLAALRVFFLPPFFLPPSRSPPLKEPATGTGPSPKQLRAESCDELQQPEPEPWKRDVRRLL